MGKIQKIRKLLSVVFAAACLAFIPGAVFAQQSTLQQEVLEPDCSQPDRCEIFAPSIEKVDINNRRPIISGRYDATFSALLRVIFGERLYTLGVDGELSAMGNNWTLDLSVLHGQLATGAYELIVEVEGYDGEIKKDVQIVRIATAPHAPNDTTGANTEQPNTPHEEPAETPEELPKEDFEIPRPMTPEEEQQQAWLVPAVVVLGSCIVLFAVGAVIIRLR